MSYPYLVTRETWLLHAMIHGASGAGKTSRGLTPQLEQFIALAGKHQDSSVIVLDLKGDQAFFESMRLASAEAGLRFRWLTTKLHTSSFAMNPFLQKHFRDLTPNQAAEMFANSFGLNLGPGYGASYFRDLAILVLRALLELPEIDSFAKLSHYTKNHPEFFNLPKKTSEQTMHLRAALDVLASIEPLNVTPETHGREIIENAIDVGEVISEPQVLYFSLPATLEDLVCFTTAKLVGYLLLTAASLRPAKDRNKVFVCIDEFQRVASPDFTVFVQQARGFDIGCILSSQTTADLDSAGTSFAEILEESTAIKIDFTGLGLSQCDRMTKQSSLAEIDAGLTDSLTRDELTRITATPGEGTIRVTMPHGLTQCGGRQVRFVAPFHISKAEYMKRRHSDWPDTSDHPGTIVNKHPRDIDPEEQAGAVAKLEDPPAPDSASAVTTPSGFGEDTAAENPKPKSLLKKFAIRILRDKE